MFRALILTATAAAALAGCASPQYASTGVASPATATAPSRQCFWASSVTNFNAVDDRTVYVRAGARRVYELELFGPCPEVDWAQRIALVSRFGSRVCSGFDATIVAPSSIGPQKCLVRNVRALSPQEVAALPPRARP